MLFIFDLDQTLVDTKIASKLRNERRWCEVYQSIPMMHLYPLISESLNYIIEKGYKLSIVTTSPRTYVQKIITYFNLNITNIVAYHDVSKQKPDPEPILKAMKNAGVNASQSISFGDRKIDITASNNAGVTSCACFWDTSERNELIKSNAHYYFQTTQDLYRFITLNY